VIENEENEGNEGNDAGCFLKKAPLHPEKLLRKKKRVAGTTSPIPVRERTSLFQSDFAIGEIGCRKLVGPLLAYARHKSAPQIYSVPPPTRSTILETYGKQCLPRVLACLEAGPDDF
jgi:hypothetical protein